MTKGKVQGQRPEEPRWNLFDSDEEEDHEVCY